VTVSAPGGATKTFDDVYTELGETVRADISFATQVE
jgi:hypothetical protein